MKLFKPVLFVSLLLLSTTLFGCVSAVSSITPSPTTTTALKNVTPVQADELIRANQGNTGFAILDVRTPAEYAESHLQNAINLDFNSPGFKDEAGRLDKNKTYLVYCRTGVRSAAAGNIMVELGFKDIYNMTGGITEWQSSGLPVVK
jgi:rhodanese-related sulfurtransferase